MNITGVHVLCIGWGEVARRFYAPALKKLSAQGLSLTVIERPDFPMREIFPGAGPVTVWGDNELARRMRAGDFTKIFILTPPQSHLEMLTLCSERLSDVNQQCEIFIEKPIGFDTGSTEETLFTILPKLKSAGHVVRLIDHYAAKWCVRWLKTCGQRAIREIAPINRLSFLSLESRAMAPSAIYQKGYAMEHGIHGWTIWLELFPEFLQPQTILRVDPANSSAWRYMGAPMECTGETGFCFTYDALLPTSGRMKVHFGSGKAVGVDSKGILIEGSNGRIFGSLSHDRVFLEMPDGSFKEPGDDKSVPKESAYDFLLKEILSGKINAADKVTLPLDAGLWALRAIEMGAKSLPSPLTIEKDRLPAVLERQKERVIMPAE